MSELDFIKRDYSPDIVEEETQRDVEWTMPSYDNIDLFRRSSVIAIALASSGCIVNANVINKSKLKSSLKPKVDFVYNKPEKSLEYYKDIHNPFHNYLTGIKNYSKGKLQKQEILKQILSFKSLEGNWDGYGSIPLEVETAANAINLIDLLGNNLCTTLSDFYPNPNGTITFVWKNEFLEQVQVEIGNETMSYFVELLGQKVEFFNTKNIDHKETQELLEKIKSI